jgi:5-methylcytosine-specific restriction endonuclease McrA
MPRTFIPVETRRSLIAEAQGRCEYCQCWARYATEPFVVEHIVPVSRGGASSLDNLAFACSGCNGHKYNKMTALDPVDGKEVPLFHPRQQRWSDHFGWNEDYTQIVG